MYRFWARDPAIFDEVNVGGTLNVLDAVAAANVERLVYTSTVGVLGLPEPTAGRPADERSHADVGHLFGHYKRTKYVAEHEVLRAGAEGLDVSLVLPTFPLGPGDRGPTPTGKLVVDFLNGQLPALVDTTLNTVHVDDLARGHLAALERGSRGRSYVLGGENLPMRALLKILADGTGLPMPKVEMPRAAALAAGIASELIEGRLLGREPRVPLEAARMSATKMVFSDERARRELGYRSRPARQAVLDSARWFAENGYVAAGRKALIHWAQLTSGCWASRTVAGSPADRKSNGKEICAPCHFQYIAHQGACGKARVVPHNRRPGPEFMEWVRVMSPAYGWRGGVRNEMRACQTRGSAESVMPWPLPVTAVRRSTATPEVSP